MTSIKIKTKRDLINIKQELKKRALKEKLSQQDFQEHIYKLNEPTVKPLEKMTEEIQKANTALKAIETQPVTIRPIQELSKLEQPLQIELPKLEEPLQIEGATKPMNVGPIAYKYLAKVYDRNYDHAYGINNINGELKIGTTPISIEGNDIIVHGEKFRMNEGVWELLNLAQPINFNEDDNALYLSLMFKTTPFLKDDGHIKAHRGWKYKNIIKPIYQKYQKYKFRKELKNIKQVRRDQDIRKSLSDGNLSYGSGLAVFIPSDINELIERHKLLFGALQSGNTGVLNEISTINDVLHQKGFLTDEDIKSFYKIFLIK